MNLCAAWIDKKKRRRNAPGGGRSLRAGPANIQPAPGFNKIVDRPRASRHYLNIPLNNNNMSEIAPHRTHSESLDLLRDKIEEVKICMMVVMDEENIPSAVPMYTKDLKDDGVAWFLTNLHSEKVAQLKKNPRVCLAYSNGTDLHVSAGGTASVTQNSVKIDELWTNADKAWFPGGKDDPDICAIGVKIDRAEYWDTPHSKLVQVFAYVASKFTGKMPDLGENEKLSL